MKKRLLSIFLALTMVVSLVPTVAVTVFAGTGDEVAEIVETAVKYPTVKDAIKATTTGQTVRLLQDCEENVSFGTEKSITLELNGKTLSSGGTTLSVSNKACLTVQDSSVGKTGKIFASGTDSAVYAVNKAGNGSFTLAGGTLEATNSGSGKLYGVFLSGAGSFTLTDGTIRATSSGSSNSHGIGISGTGSAYLNGGKVESTASGTGSSDAIYCVSGGSVTVDGAEISAKAASGGACGVQLGKNSTAVVSLTAGSIAAEGSGGGAVVGIDSSNGTGALTLNGGSVTAETTGTGTVSGVSASAATVSVGGASVSAVSVANANASGLYLTGTAGLNLTAGSIRCENKSGSAYGVSNSGSGSVTVSGGSISAATPAGTGKTFGVRHVGGGTVALSAGSVEARSATAAECFGVYRVGEGSITVSGGTVTALMTGDGGCHGIRVGNSAGLTMEAGKVEATTTGADHACGVCNTGIGTVEISGGEIIAKANEASDCLALNAASTGEYAVEDGKVDGKAVVSGGAFTITGGMFTVDPTAVLGVTACAEVIPPSNPGDPYIYKVTDYPVAHDGAHGYSTVQRAIDASAKGATITVLKDVSESLSVTEKKSLTLDLNGNTITGTGTSSVINNNGVLTVKDSDSTKVHYFTDEKKWDSTANEGAGGWVSGKDGCFETLQSATFDINGKTEGTDYVKVLGGCITGGKAAQGGGIFNGGEKAVLKLEGGTIYNCVAAKDSGAESGNGGGVFNAGKSCTMTGGTIQNCSADCGGGGVYNEYYTSKFYFNGGTIQNCTALKSGGGIYNEGTVEINGGKLIDCQAADHGCGVWNSCILKMTDGEIKDCVAPNDGSIWHFGAAVYNDANALMETEKKYTTTFDMSGGTISGCRAVFGGAILNEGKCVVKLSGTAKIKNNTADDEGGAIFNCTDGIVSLTGSAAITNNKSGGYGAGIFNQGNCSITVGNEAKVTDNKQGSGATEKNSNVYLPSGNTFGLGTGRAAPGSNMSIGVTTATAPKDGTRIPVTGAYATDYSGCFSSDNSSYQIIKDGTKAKPEVKLRGHEHKWAYEASGNTITATCTDTLGTCDNEENTTVSLTAPANRIYDGKDKLAACSSKTLVGQESLPAITYEYKATEDGSYATASNLKDVGFYKASLTVDGKTASVEYAISKATPTVTMPTASALTCGKTLADSTLSGGKSNIPGTFAWKEPTMVPGVSDEHAAEYDVVFTPNDTANYNPVVRKVKLFVTDATLKVSTTSAKFVIADTGMFTAEVTNRPAGSYVVWSTKGASNNVTGVAIQTDVVLVQFTAKGNVTVTATLMSKDGHVLLENSQTVKVTNGPNFIVRMFRAISDFFSGLFR